MSQNFLQTLNKNLSSYVHEVKHLTPTIVEVVVKSPLAARNFRPGQFFRLQNYSAYAKEKEFAGRNYKMAMEGLALTGAWVDVESGLIGLIVLEMGGSSNFCTLLENGEPVALMGPTGTPTEIPANENVMLVGGGLGNAVLFSIGKALRENNSRVVYFAGYKHNDDRFRVADIEAASDVVIWCCDEKPEFVAGRSQDKVFHGNMVEAITAYGNGTLGEQVITLADISRIIAIGSDRMMDAVRAARHHQLKGILNESAEAIGSINSPMQCMMKEICGQCLQRHHDPATGIEHYVYSCNNQDQKLDVVDFSHLHQRLRQNSLQEKLTSMMINKLYNAQLVEPV